MKTFPALAAALALAACVSYSGHGLVPGQSSADEVEAKMGPAADRRPGADGETLRYYPRQPYGREMYVARIGPDGRLRAIEQRLTEANVALLRPGGSSADEVRSLLGPPFQVTDFARMEREVWTYKMYGEGIRFKDLHVQFSRDRIVREVMIMDDPQFAPRNAMN